MKIILFDNTFSRQVHNKVQRNPLSIYPEASLTILPETSLLIAKRPLFLPDMRGPIKANLVWAIRIDRLGRCVAERFADRYYDKVTIGVAMVAEGYRSDLLAVGGSDIIARSFDGAVCLGEWEETEHLTTIKGRVSLDCLTAEFEEENWRNKANNLVSLVSKYQTIRQGDILLVQTPCFLEMNIDKRLMGMLQEKQVLSVNVK